MTNKWTAADIPDQSGKTIIITGANCGLGLASAKRLTEKGASVIMACRSEKRGRDAAQEVGRETGITPEMMLLDLSNLESVRSFAEAFRAEYKDLHVLLNNAGIMATPFNRTEDGFESQIGINHLGHFALTGLLLPVLLDTKDSRIVNVSSLAARSGMVRPETFRGDEQQYSPWAAYNQSKLANLFFTLELNRRLHGKDTIAIAAHPGGAATNLGRNVKTSKAFQWFAKNILLPLLPTANQNARPQLYASTMPNVHGGHYYGPGGIGEIGGAPTQVKLPGSIGTAEELEQLWIVSEELTGVRFDI